MALGTSQRFTAVAVVTLAGLFLAFNRSQVPAAWQAGKQSNPAFLGAAAIVALLYLLNYGAMYRAAYRAVGLDIPFLQHRPQEEGALSPHRDALPLRIVQAFWYALLP